MVNPSKSVQPPISFGDAGNSAQPLPVRVDFTKPLPLKATISPCAASSPGGAVVPGQKTWGFWWIFPWMSDGCLIDFDGFVWGYFGFLWFLGGCLWYDSRFFGNFQWIGGCFSPGDRLQSHSESRTCQQSAAPEVQGWSLERMVV